MADSSETTGSEPTASSPNIESEAPLALEKNDIPPTTIVGNENNPPPQPIDQANATRPAETVQVKEGGSVDKIAERKDDDLNENPTGSNNVDTVGLASILENVVLDENKVEKNDLDAEKSAGVVTTSRRSSAAKLNGDLDAALARMVKAAYVPPKLIVTPVDLASMESETPAKAGCCHIACQTMISSAPSLNVDIVSSTVIEDPDLAEVVTVMKRFQRVLRRIFDHYAINGTMKTLDETGFLTMMKEFSILPTLIEQEELVEIFDVSTRLIPDRLSFRDLVECFTRLALTIYRENKRLGSSEQKLSCLFRAMQLDQKDIVLHRLRKPVHAAVSVPFLNDTVSLDFDQKDLDAEISKIMETLPVNMDSPPTDPISAPDMEIIGPISAQVLSTIDQVKQHTDDMKRNIQRRSSLTSKAGEPTRKTLHPMAHLPPLFYPGSSYSRMYDQKKEADVATATVSESVPTAGKTSKLAKTSADRQSITGKTHVSEQKKEETKETPKTKPKMKQQALKIKAEVKGGGKRETGETVREKAKTVAVSEREAEQLTQKKHLAHIERRRNQQLERVQKQGPSV